MFCRTCGLEIKEGDSFCRSCGTRAIEPLDNIESAQDNQKDVNNIPLADKKTNEVTVKGVRYSGRKWFLKLPYKLYETDVDFTNQYMILKQGTGFAKPGPKVSSQIFYNRIYNVDAKKKYSIPNVIFACVTALLSIIMQIWPALIISLIVFFIGKTAVVSLHHSAGMYDIPTEFFSDAEELRNKINAAIGQARG